MRFHSLHFALPLAAALGVACADPSGGSAQPAAGFVAADDNYFTPVNVDIGVGGTVTWTVTGGPHTVTFITPSAPPDCEPMAAGETCVRTFPSRGTFNYGCQYHEAMIGTIRAD